MAESSKHLQRWDIEVHGRHHRVEVDSSGWSRVIRWYVDGERVAEKKSGDESLYLSPGDGLDETDSDEDDDSGVATSDSDDLLGEVGDSGDDQPAGRSPSHEHEGPAELGVIGAKFSSLGKPRRVTWFGQERLDADPDEESTDDADEPDESDESGDGKKPSRAMAHAVLGVGGIDLDPEPGSPAALREARIRAHPRRYTAIQTAGGVAKVVLPILLGLIAVRFVVNIPWPSIPWPNIPWPDLPSIPWPDIPWPSIPWPDINLPHFDFEVPGWVRWLLDKAKYVVPILIAFALARNELRRRRKQDELKERIRARANGPGASTGDQRGRATDSGDPRDRPEDSTDRSPGMAPSGGGEGAEDEAGAEVGDRGRGPASPS